MKEDKAREIFLKAISDKTRYGIISCLRRGSKSVNGMKCDCDLDQTLVSYHLKYLKKIGFVNYKKDGKMRIYSLDKEITPILTLLDKGIRKYRNKLNGSKLA